MYQLNAGVIGPNPNVLMPGTVIYVPNRCTTSGSGVYDRGPSMYANGTVTGNVYTVAPGDTWYSIGVRFGLPWETISAANGGGSLYPGRQLIIPGLASAPRRPRRPTSASRIPQAGAKLPATFTVSGKGAGLPEGNVVVTAMDSAGRVLAQKATVLQGPNVGVGGEGTWSTSLTVNVGDITLRRHRGHLARRPGDGRGLHHLLRGRLVQRRREQRHAPWCMRRASARSPARRAG